jgi:PAS domain S-box-containing protein
VRIFRRSFLIILTVVTVFILLLITVLMIRFTNPIKSLAAAAKRISEGDLEQDIPVSSRDEVGELAGSFNDMQDSIHRKIGDLNREILERKRVEKELKKAQSLVSNIIDSMPSALIGLDSDGKVTHWNSSAEGMTGISGSEAFGRLISELMPLEEGEIKNIFEAMKSGETRYDSGMVRLDKGQTIIEDITIYPLNSESVQGAVIRIDDVTERTLLEEKLVHSQKMDAIGQLAGGVAHDFNNMLAGISGAASLLKPICADVDKADSFIDLILEASERASDLTAKLLAFGRKGGLDTSSIDIREVLDETLSLLERTIDKSIHILREGSLEHPFIMGNFTAVQNSLMNLAINASHAMDGGGSLTFSVTNRYLDHEFCLLSPFELSPGEFIGLRVEDTGCGIPQEHLDRIFDPFFTTKEKGKGTGLGLASVYAAVRDHGGAIQVESHMGKGTAFTLYLPCTERSALTREKVMDTDSTGSGTILLVDDEEMIRFTVRAQLEAIGYSVFTASDGREALEIWEREKDRLSLIVSDMIMPEMSGKELFLELIKRNLSCPFTIMSGYTRDENLHELTRQGLAGFIQKPFTHNELVEHLERALHPPGEPHQ